jgi:hypothetical protein
MKIPSNLSLSELVALVIEWLSQALAEWIAARDAAGAADRPGLVAAGAGEAACAGVPGGDNVRRAETDARGALGVHSAQRGRTPQAPVPMAGELRPATAVTVRGIAAEATGLAGSRAGSAFAVVPARYGGARRLTIFDAAFEHPLGTSVSLRLRNVTHLLAV